MNTEKTFSWKYLQQRAGFRLSFVGETLGLDLDNKKVVEKDDEATVEAYRKLGYDNLEIGDLYDILPMKKAGKKK